MLLRTELSDERRWADVVRVVDAWNASERPQVKPVLDLIFEGTFAEDERAQLDRFVERLRPIEEKGVVTVVVTDQSALEDEDYAKADFVELFGTDVDITPPLVVNEAQAFPPSAPCPRCGSYDALGPAPAAPLVVDTTRLDTADGPVDAVHLPNGDRLVTRRFASVLQDNAVVGYELHEVIDAATATPSTAVFHLTARKAIVEPCAEHTKIGADGICPGCGTAYGQVEGFVWVRSDEVGEDEVISRHPTRGPKLYVSRRVLGLLEGAGLRGLQRGDVLMVCRH